MKKAIFTAGICFALMFASFMVSAQQPQVQDIPGPYMAIVSDSTSAEGVRFLEYIPSQKVCSRRIKLQVKDGVIASAQFVGGCSGNTQGVCSLIKGMPVSEAIEKLDGILCGRRGTSCPDQLANALKLISK